LGAEKFVESGTLKKSVVRFGTYEADLRDGILTKRGLRIKIQGQPFRILALLLERPGEVISREEIQQKLWPDNTFVEFDDGLNAAVGKLRAALGDSADNPRFVETVPRRGYRFVAPVTLPPVTVEEVQPQPEISPAESVRPDDVRPDDVRPDDPGDHGRIPRRSVWLALVLTGALTVLAYSIYLHRRPRSVDFTAKDTLVIADFVNTTGEVVFDDALKPGLAVGLEQSPYLNVLSERQVAATLGQMGRSADEPLTQKVALEVCQRAGSKIMVTGSISSLGTSYLLGLAAIRCDTGDPITNEQVTPRRKEDVIEALGQAATRLRSKLGESMASIQKYDAPLEEATTPSLEALRAYTLALKTWDQKGDGPSVPLFQQAIEADPNFAMAHAALGTIYHNLNEVQLATAQTTRAYELRGRLTNREKISIESRYYRYVTGELDKAAQVYERAIQTLPHARLGGTFTNLADVHACLGQYAKAVAEAREALRLDPGRSTSYANLTLGYLAIGQLNEAGKTLAEARKRELAGPYLSEAAYALAFLNNDNKEMQRILAEALARPDGKAEMLSLQSNTESYYGRFEKSRELMRTAVDLAKHDGDKEAAADYLAEAALQEAEAGAGPRARSYAAEALALAPGLDVRTLTALALARAGDVSRAQAMAEHLDKEFPLNTLVHSYWLPVIRLALDLERRKSSSIPPSTEAAALMEIGALPPLHVGTLYPVYLRGQAYLAVGQGGMAAAEFQKILDHSGVVRNFPLGALAHLGLARAYALSKDVAKSRGAYQDFLTLWKDGDSAIPILKQARSEYLKLH
jgi:DNA-binding winged helix-turn-helix (wHTH) protein/tetratricopeptide (TPR) repeat protein